MALNVPAYDPASTAQALAEKYTLARQQTLDTQNSQARATEKALTELNSAILAFQSSLASLTGFKKTMYAQSATFSDTAIGSATASSTAAAGTYSFFVEKLATASQVSYTGLTDNDGVGGTLDIKLGGVKAFDVNLSAADSDGNGTLTTRELAAAINGASGNASLVTASIITTGATSELVLTAKNTGASTAITIDTSLVTRTPDGGGVARTYSLTDANNDATRKRILVQAQDATIRVGSETGTAITQATNTFTNIDGVSMTFTKAHASGAAPVTITVGADNGGTTANVQAFVDAFNKLKTTLTKLTDPGDPASGVAGGPFAHDAGMRALNARLTSLLRPASGDSLAAFGILATREGTLELRSDRLLRQLTVNPTGIDTLIGTVSGSTPTGISASLESYLKTWSNSIDGQIKLRKEATTDLLDKLVDRQAVLDKQYDSAYQRYLEQFTQLQSLQGAMTYNASLFDALFSKDD